MKRSFDNFKARLTDAGLLFDVQTRAMRMRTSLKDLYDAPTKVPSVVAARRDVYKWLMKNGKSLNEVARLFDRAPNGVWKLTKIEVRK